MNSLIGRQVEVRGSLGAFLGVALLAVFCVLAGVTSAQASGHNPELISADSSGTHGSDNSEHPSTSEDGRYIAFQSTASNLVSPDANGAVRDIFVKDTATGEITLVSTNANGVQADDLSGVPSISNDGRYVAFESDATNLDIPEVLRSIIQAGSTQVYVKDLETGAVTLVSSSSTGTAGDGNSHQPEISGNGLHVTYYSYATNLVDGDTNSVIDVFVKQLSTGLTERVSVNSEGGQVYQDSHEPSISDSGRYIAFQSDVTNFLPPVEEVLVRETTPAADTNDMRDIYVKDMETGSVVLASVRWNGVQTSQHSYQPSISGNGGYVVFHTTDAAVSGDTNAGDDVFRRDLEAETTTRVSLDDGGAQHLSGGTFGDISYDGRYVTFIRTGGGVSRLGQFGTSQVFVIDSLTSQVVRLSESQAGVEGNDSSQDLGIMPPSIANDGRHVAFHSLATNLVTPDSNGARDIFKTFNPTWAPPEVSVWPRASDLAFGSWSKLAGTVVDGSGNSIPNQKVWLQYWDGPLNSLSKQKLGSWKWLKNVYTNENGYYQHWFYYEGGSRNYRAKEAEYGQVSNPTQIALTNNISAWNNYRPKVRYCQWTKIHGKYGGPSGVYPNHTLYMQRKSGSSWVWQATVKTNSTGYYSAWASVCPTTTFRMATAGSAVTSAQVTKIGSKITAWQNTKVHASLKDGYGSGVSGMKLYLQKWNGSSWTWQGTCTTSSSGYCNFGSKNPSGTLRVATGGSKVVSGTL